MQMTPEQFLRTVSQNMAGMVNPHMTPSQLRAAARTAVDASHALQSELEARPPSFRGPMADRKRIGAPRRAGKE